MTEDVTKMPSEDLADEVRAYLDKDRKDPHPALNEMVRRLNVMARCLKDIENAICWSVDCVHKAKELDKSYNLQCALERAQKVLGNVGLVNHAPKLREALYQLVEALGGRGE
jgi:hypothetical protein